MKTKILLSVIIAIVMVSLLLSVPAFAETFTSGETVNLKLNEPCSVALKVDNKETYTDVKLIGELPEGLSWGYGEAENPYIKGTPTKAGTYEVTFECHMYETDDIIKHTAEIIVKGPEVYNSKETVNIKVNKPCSVVLKVDNKETYTKVDLIGELPEGLSWGYGEAEDPYIQGTPTKAGTYEVTFECHMYETDDIIKHTAEIVVAGGEVYNSKETVNIKVNKPCSVVLKVDNKETYTKVDLIGELPEGLSWGYGEAEDPYIQGTPTKAGTYEVTFECHMYETDDIVRHTVTIKVTDSNAEVEKFENPFVDIAEESYYYDAILWAYYAEPQVTKGVDETHFGPNKTVTRGQTVTFLWRAMGEPEPKTTKNPFADVKTDDYYYKAVLWAVESGITVGIDSTHFSPDATCSTAHITTFLYRTLDIGNDGWYEAAAKWAEDNGLLKDINKKVAPNVNCPRADVVTFLYCTVGK